MKLAPLLARYLHEHNRLDLPGIGTFSCSPSAFPEEDVRRPRGQEPVTVSFENNPAIKENPGLISFIASQTGKIKALAAADLDSYLELAKQFLNIGKPFLFEGIGSLVKNRPGEYSLASSEPLFDKTKGSEKDMSATEHTSGEYSSILKPKKEKISWRKPAVALLVIAGLGLAVWGGYTVYKITTAKNKTEKTGQKAGEEQGTQTSNKDTSLQKQVPVAPVLNDTLPRNFKIVVETADSNRALSRYRNLVMRGVKDVQVETKDSVTYKIFFIVASKPADTASVLRTYRNNYTPPGKVAFIEN